MDIFTWDGEVFAVGPSEIFPGWYDVVDAWDFVINTGPTLRDAVDGAVENLEYAQEWLGQQLEGIL